VKTVQVPGAWADSQARPAHPKVKTHTAVPAVKPKAGRMVVNTGLRQS